jgi:hypothetical protein
MARKNSTTPRAKGNAKKPDMQAAAKVRWGKDLGEDEADAAWAGAFALDCELFTS